MRIFLCCQDIRKQMKKLRKLVLLLMIVLPAANMQAQEASIEVIHFPDLENWFNAENDTLYVINFWATWCRPCVAELPFFDDVAAEHKDEPVQVLLISLDFADEVDGKVAQYIERRDPKSPILVLDEPNANKWIDKVAVEWTGAIPATVFVNKKHQIREFHEGDYTREELFDKVETLIHRP